MSSHPSTPHELADKVGTAAGHIMQSSHRLVDDAARLSKRGGDLLRHRGEQWQTSAEHARDATLHYMKQEPVKTVLIAATAGVALMWLVSLFGRRGPD